jgi:hypothetical protein
MGDQTLHSRGAATIDEFTTPWCGQLVNKRSPVVAARWVVAAPYPLFRGIP